MIEMLHNEARKLLIEALEKKHKVQEVAYGTNSIRTYITEQRASYTIPPKSNVIEPWFCDFHTYKERHLIECFFNKLKVFRRVATRYDKLAVSFLAFVHLASIWILLK